MPDWSTNNIKIILKILVDQSVVDHSGCTRFEAPKQTLSKYIN